MILLLILATYNSLISHTKVIRIHFVPKYISSDWQHSNSIGCQIQYFLYCTVQILYSILAQYSLEWLGRNMI